VTNIAAISGGNEPAVNTGNNSALIVVPVVAAAVNTFQTDGGQTGTPGTSVLYTHVFNVGIAGSVVFTSTHIPSPTIVGWTVQIYRDLNCNGVIDGADGITDISGASIAVTPPSQVCIIVKSNIPANASLNAVDQITVTATFTPTVGPVVTYARIDVTTTGALFGSGLTLQKTVRNVTQNTPAGTNNTAKPGDVLEYVVTYRNTSNAPLSSVVINDVTPSFTTFLSALCGGPLPNNITACALTTTPGVGINGPVQWTLSGTLAPAQSGTVSFQVSVQ
jgi:uncharacterized repeat protein (TIGR01451 family)